MNENRSRDRDRECPRAQIERGSEQEASRPAGLPRGPEKRRKFAGILLQDAHLFGVVVRAA